MSETEYVDLEDVVGIVRYLGMGPLCDVDLLGSAVSQPRSSASDENAYQTANLGAAVMLHSMANSYAPLDGNERVAWLSIVVLCEPKAVNHGSALTMPSASSRSSPG